MSSVKSLVVALAVAVLVAIPAATEAQVPVPPQAVGPMTATQFVEAVNNQPTHTARLNRLPNIPGQHITVIPISRLSPSPTAAGVSAAESRAAGRATAVQTALTRNTVVANALQSAGISAGNVVAFAVRGHNLNDLTIYHR